MIHATLTLSGIQGCAWLLNIWDDDGNVNDYLAFRSGLMGRRYAEREAGQKLDWTIESRLQTADWE